MLKNIRVVLIVVLLLCPTLSAADRIYLKSGRSFEGEIVSESDEAVKVKIQFGSGFVESTYSKTDIDHIEKPPAKEKEPTVPKSEPQPRQTKSTDAKPTQTNLTGGNLVIQRMAQLLLSLNKKCKGSNQEIADIVTRAHEILRDKDGIDVNELELMEALNMFVPDEVTNLDCTSMMGVVIMEYQKKR